MNQVSKVSELEKSLGMKPITTWEKILTDVDFKEVIEIPSNNLSNNTEDSLDWYTYDLSVHRIDPNDGVYVVEKNDMWFKINFLSYSIPFNFIPNLFFMFSES